MSGIKYEKKSEAQLHGIAESSHQTHKSVTGQVPGIRDDEGDDDDSDDEPRSPHVGISYYVEPPADD